MALSDELSGPYTTVLSYNGLSQMSNIKPNTHRRRRRDETVLSRRVGVGGVYMNSRRLPTDSAMRTHNAAPVYNSAANGIEVRYDVTYDAACL